MPFGIKKDVDGNPVNFDQVYKDIINPAIEEIDVTCLRCDEINQSGMIHKDMFGHIYYSDIAVVDISVLNPNVFYELGILDKNVKKYNKRLYELLERIKFRIQLIDEELNKN
jgi:hypothetical protein